MANKFVIGDTHFFHDNTWKLFKKADGTPLRSFTSTHEMNEHMVDCWNAVVQHDDKVYHLGDVTFRYDGAFTALMQRLNGQKRLILGNHDKIKGTKLMDFFEKVELWKGWSKEDFTMSHIPLRLDSLRDGIFNVHGHLHNKEMLDKHYINVCVEVINYVPMSFDELLDIIKERKKLLK